MNVMELKDVIKVGYDIKRPVCALSSPGVGKSSAFLQCCEELSEKYNEPFELIEVRGASASPSELAAIKYVQDGSVQEAEQGWLPTNEKVEAGLCAPRGMIFCDEMADAVKVTQSTLQRLFLDRKLGGLSVADNWYIGAASNRASDKAAAGKLSRAFQNRCMMVSVLPDAETFVHWGIDAAIDPTVLSFVRFKPSSIMDGLVPHRGENEAFCSPRSLHIVSDVLKNKSSNSLPEHLVNELITGTLGDGVGAEFSGFLRIRNGLPNLDELLKNPKDYPISEKIDVNWATVGALHHRANKDNVKAIMQYFVRLTVDLSAVAIKDLAKHEKACYKTEEFVKWASKNLHYTT